ncbi:MAG: iron-sulfur cluster assembly accessory protein [Ferruginibacter sp.]|nr:iron-sulfur cluster assembly accessory protein [Ferruginibacter sp.]
MNSGVSDIKTSAVLPGSENPPLKGREASSLERPSENGIFISDKAKVKVINLMKDAGLADDPSYFLRVGVVGGGCSGLSYKMDFDNEQKPMDQVFEDKGVKIVTDLKSFLYLVNTELEFSDGLNGKGFYFNNPNASRSCGCGESFAV